MGWIFVPLVFILSVFTLLGYIVALDGHRKDYENNKDVWYGTIICTSVTFLLMSLYTALSSNVLVSDLFMVIILIAFFALIASVLYGRSYKKKYNDKKKFKKPTWITFSVLVVFFLLFGMTSPTEAENQENTVANNTLEEDETEEVTEETTTGDENAAAEKKGEEEQKASESDEEESIEEEKAKEAAEKEKEESIEEAKKKEESIEAEKEKEASIEEKQKKEESIEAEKEESIEKEEQEESTEEEPEEESMDSKDGLIPVDLYRVVDGDTVNVIDDNGEELDLRLLLIDTPETVHPNKPVEPYGEEASARLTELLNNADQLYIEYDSGEKTDHYDRHLVYLYADDENVHEILLEEGLARVGYIYEQQKYLSDFREAEQHAKDNQLGIWSIPGYVNEGGEGFNSEESEPESTSEPETSEPETTEQPAQSESFENCDDLRGTHPNGVEQGHPAYQSKMDRDEDGWACEVS